MYDSTSALFRAYRGCWVSLFIIAAVEVPAVLYTYSLAMGPYTGLMSVCSQHGSHLIGWGKLSQPRRYGLLKNLNNPSTDMNPINIWRGDIVINEFPPNNLQMQLHSTPGWHRYTSRPFWLKLVQWDFAFATFGSPSKNNSNHQVFAHHQIPAPRRQEEETNLLIMEKVLQTLISKCLIETPIVF